MYVHRGYVVRTIYTCAKHTSTVLCTYVTLIHTQPAVATGRSETHSTGPHRKKRGAKLKKVVSNITRRVANNRLVRRAAERAVERARSVPLELRVEVRKLKGIVAVNIPPPPSDTIW